MEFSDQTILTFLKGHEDSRKHEKCMFTWNVYKSNNNKRGQHLVKEARKNIQLTYIYPHILHEILCGQH